MRCDWFSDVATLQKGPQRNDRESLDSTRMSSRTCSYRSVVHCELAVLRARTMLHLFARSPNKLKGQYIYRPILSKGYDGRPIFAKAPQGKRRESICTCTFKCENNVQNLTCMHVGGGEWELERKQGFQIRV